MLIGANFPQGASRQHPLEVNDHYERYCNRILQPCQPHKLSFMINWLSLDIVWCESQGGAVLVASYVKLRDVPTSYAARGM